MLSERIGDAVYRAFTPLDFWRMRFTRNILLPDSDTVRGVHLVALSSLSVSPFGYRSGESRYIPRTLHDESHLYSESLFVPVTWATQEIPHTIALGVART